VLARRAGCGVVRLHGWHVIPAILFTIIIIIIIIIIITQLVTRRMSA